METKKLEVMVGKKPTTDVPKDKIGKTHAKPQKQDEVGGRELTMRWVQCPHCGALGSIVYDTVNIHGYTCHICGGLIVA